MPTADSAGVTGLEVAAGPKVPVDDAANVPAAGGQILPDLTRAVCGRRVSSWRSAVVYNHACPDSAALSVPKIGGLAISFDDLFRRRAPARRSDVRAGRSAGGDVRRAGSVRSCRHIR